MTSPAEQPAHPPATTFTPAGIARGFREMMPISISIFVFAAAFGLTARNIGLDPWLAWLMSAMVFAGAAQFAVLDLWQTPVPWVPLLLATFAVNARHLLLGASLYSWCRGLPRWKRYVAMTMLSDTNWALSIAAHGKGERDFGHMFGGGLLLWVSWTSGTLVGAAIGGFTLADIQRYGLDMVFVVFFACTLLGLRRGRLDDLPWLVAGIASVAAVWWLPPNWHVLVGGIAGGVAGLIQHERRPSRGTAS
jgi:4-azaleucine resistance transporter AzlC